MTPEQMLAMMQLMNSQAQPQQQADTRNELRGALWPSKEEKKYAYDGEVTVSGVRYKLFAYLNEKHDEDNKQPVLRLSLLKSNK